MLRFVKSGSFSSFSHHQVYSIWFFILYQSALEHCWVSVINEISVMQYCELFFNFIHFILTDTYEPVLPYHITVFPKTEMWHTTNTTTMLARTSGASYSFHTVTQRGQSSNPHSLKFMPEFLVINNSYICIWSKSPLYKRQLWRARSERILKINGGNNVTSRDLWGKVFLICLRCVGNFLNVKWHVWMYVDAIDTVFGC